MKTYACVYLGSTLLSLLATPAVIRMARRKGLVDACGVRKAHRSSVPRIGGLAIMAAMLAMSVPAIILDNVIGEEFRAILPQVVALLAGAVFIAIVGLVDDIRGLSARVKLSAQVAAALAVCAFGVRIDSITIGQWFRLDFGWLAWPITVFWIVGITNAVNLIDGLDGLAAGISAATCGVIAVFSFYTNQPVMAVLMLALLGGLTGFLKSNFHPAKIFMGDCGSLFLGFTLAGASVMCTMKSAALVGLALPALTLGLPIFDTLFSILRRILQRRSIFAPDRSHIHHRLLDMGFRQRRVVVIMYMVTLAAGGMGMFMMITRDAGTLIVFACALALLILVFRTTGTVRLQECAGNLRRCLAFARQARQDKRACESAELHRAETLDAWWTGLCTAAEKMNFSRLSLSLSGPGGSPVTLVWLAEPRRQPPSTGAIHLHKTVGAHVTAARLRIEADIPIDDSLESAGRRASLFGRLIDHNGAPELPADSLAA